MNRVIRGSGYTLLILVLLAILFVFVVLDIVVERLIEAKASEIVGAKVELNRVDVTFFPLGAELLKLEVTDPDRPMTNALEAGAIAIHLEAAPLLARKVIVDDLAIDGLRFNTPRTTSGALPGTRSKIRDDVGNKRPGQDAVVSGFRIPDVRSILEQENLRSVALARELKDSAEGRVRDWENQLKQLPDEQTFKTLEARINKLGKTQSTVSGVLDAATELQSIQTDIDQSLNFIKSAMSELGKEKDRYGQRLREAIRAPEEDFHQLKEKYGLSVGGFGNLTKLFLEDSFRNYVDTGLRWYARIQPYLSGTSEGAKRETAVGAPKKEPQEAAGQDSLPDFLVRVATVSAELPWGRVNGRVDNITDNQSVLGLPTLFDLGAVDLEGLKNLTLKGTYDELKAAAASVDFDLVAEGFRISDLFISESKDMPILLKQGLGNLDVNGSISGDQIASKIFLKVQDALFQTGTTEEGSDALKVISSALQQIDHLGLSADITGTFTDYAIQLKSNLDGTLRSAFESEAKRLVGTFEKELRTGIREESERYLDEATTAISGLDAVGQRLEERQALANTVLRTARKSGGGTTLKLPF